MKSRDALLPEVEVVFSQYGTDTPGNKSDDNIPPPPSETRSSFSCLSITVYVPGCSVHVHGMCVGLFYFIFFLYSTVDIYVS